MFSEQVNSDQDFTCREKLQLQNFNVTENFQNYTTPTRHYSESISLVSKTDNAPLQILDHDVFCEIISVTIVDSHEVARVPLCPFTTKFASAWFKGLYLLKRL